MLQTTPPRRHAYLVVLSLLSCGTCMLVFSAPDLFDDIHRDSSTNSASRVVGAIATLMFVQVGLTPLCGALSDGYGRKPLFLAACIVHTSVMLALACVPSKFAFQGCFLLFATLNATFAMGYAMAGDCSLKGQLTPCFGLVDAAFGVGVTSGLVIGRFLSTRHSAMPFAAATMINLAGLLITRRYVYETLDDVHRKPSLTVISAWSASFRLCCREPAVLSLLLVICCMHMCGTVHVILYFYMNYRFGWQLKSQLVFFSFEGFCIVFCLTVGLKALWHRHWTNRQLVLGGVVLQSTSLAASAFMTSGWQVYPIFGLGTLHMTAFPALRSIAHQLVSPHDRGCLHGRLAFVTTATMVIAEPVVKLIVRISIADDLQKKHPRPCPLGYRGVLDGYSNCGGMPGLVFSAASCLLMVVFAMAYLLVAPPATQRFKITLGPPVPRSACIEESSS
ncbi:hypothetical protein H257_00567 [Aphanomyces astaci]|uniref:Major facilitator superfamily (MFS) profile domain-containing protein n=1 Tax=Aphanomyces astaci TaxID=112090 RepID=W4HB99_APHAT|nr:hypothetical protein H257_00567 [Aphanomyces astaci]ETV89207.1 hypothetical protein H257_00567 [Aphanomyces astaci]|eukprot:XP_009821607.1 hypothetical protein H257_00567 [Aphanomyces astaci]